LGQIPDHIKDALRKVENYQTIQLDNGICIDGKRTVYDRWEFIEPIIAGGLYVDVGSNFGGFTRYIAKKPGTVVVSFEANPWAAKIQKWTLEEEGLDNVILINGPLQTAFFLDWMRCVELIDGILFMSILHHFPVTHALSIWKAARNNIPNVFWELPNPSDGAACGRETFQKLTSVLEESSVRLGTTPSHTGPPRNVYLDQKWSFEFYGKNYLGCPTDKMSVKKVTYGTANKWSVEMIDRSLHVGVNLWNLLGHNIIYPSREKLADMGVAAYQKVIKNEPHVEDIRPWNLIFTPHGMKVIDYATIMNGQDDYTLEHLRQSILTGKY